MMNNVVTITQAVIVAKRIKDVVKVNVMTQLKNIVAIMGMALPAHIIMTVATITQAVIVATLIANYVAREIAVVYQTVKFAKTELVSGLFQRICSKLMLKKTWKMVRFISNMNGNLPQET